MASSGTGPFLFVCTVIVFLFVLPIYACSGCDVRKRAEKQACRAGDADKCLFVADYYDNKADGLIGFAMSNGATAQDYYYLACKTKGVGCSKMRHSHHDSAKDPRFSLTDEADALIAACAERATPTPAGSEPCSELWDFMDGVDWAQNRAGQQFADRCNAGGAAACYWLARMHGGRLAGFQNTFEEVLPLYDKACAAGVPPACKGAQDYRDEQARRAAQSGGGAGSDVGSGANDAGSGASSAPGSDAP